MIQGSVGSCILYTIFTADIPLAVHPHPLQSSTTEDTCNFPQVSTYVDDYHLVTHGVDVAQLTERAQLSIDRIEDYMKANRLQLNIPKTACMASPSNVSVSIQTSGQPVLSTPTVKVLGITFSSDLKWDTNAKQILAQLSYRLTILRTIKPLANFSTLKKIATALIVSKVAYSLPAWGNLPQHLQQRFQSCLLTAARICLGPAHARSSTSKLLGLMKWMSFPQMVEHQTSKILHQVLVT